MKALNFDQIVEKWDMLSERKRDEWVARDVMGLKGLELMSEFLKPYSTDMNAALDVVVKLQLDHNMYIGVEMRNYGGCYIQIRDYHRSYVSTPKAFESVPIGVCLSALYVMQYIKK